MKQGFIRVGACSPKIRLADVKYNAGLIIDLIKKADKECIQLLVFPELCLTGAVCKELFLHEILLDETEKQLERIAEETKNCRLVCVIGAPLRIKNRLCDCAAVISNGEIFTVPKNVFSESSGYSGCSAEADKTNKADKAGFCAETVYVPVASDTVFRCRNYKPFTFGITIGSKDFSSFPVSDKLCGNGALIVVNCSADAELAGRADKRKRFARVQSEKNICAYIYCGAGEGESTSENVYSGHCFVYEAGELLAERKPFEKSDLTNEILITEIDLGKLEYERRFAAKKKDSFGVSCENNTAFTLNNAAEIQFAIPFKNGMLPVLDFHRKFRRNPFIPDNKDELHARLENILMIQSYGLKRRVEHIHAKCAVVGISGGLDSSLALIAAANCCDIMGVDRKFVKAYTMPCFGTTEHTKNNAVELCEALGVDCKTIPISEAVLQHFKDIGHDESDHSVVYENAQARMRTLVLMDIANKTGGLVIGTGDLSEQALGWATYNGDHMSMYGLNAGVPKTVIREIIRLYGIKSGDERLEKVLQSILDTPVSPELLPAEDGKIAQITEDLVGPYELHDFFLYYVIKCGYPPAKLYRVAKEAFKGSGFDNKTILKWLRNFYRRFFSQQFKRDCLPDGPAVGSINLSPRGGFLIPSDAFSSLWMQELDELAAENE